MSEEREERIDSAEPEPVDERGEEMEALRRELEDAKERYLRTLAELDNLRKRGERDREQMRLYAVENLVRDLLPVLDNLQLAQEAEGDADAIREGVRLALQEALRILQEKGVERIDAAGRPFDPRVHEAVGVVPGSGRPPGTVVVELRPGYRLHDRLLRPSRVHVAMDAPGAGGEEADEPGEDREER